MTRRRWPAGALGTGCATWLTAVATYRSRFEVETMMNRFRHAGKALAMAAGVAAAVVAMASNASALPNYPEFTIKPSALGGPSPVPGGGGVTISDCPGALPGTNGCVNADKLIGNYTEVFTGTGTPLAGTFSVDVTYTAAAFIDHADSVGAVQLTAGQS